MADVAAVLRDTQFTPEAAVALSFMGSAAVPPLRDAVNAPEPIVRREAMRSLGKLRERASIDPQLVVPVLVKGLDDADASVRAIAVTYLGIVRDDPDREVDGLISAMADPEAEVREAAVVALFSYGLLAERAVPALQKAASSDSNDDVKREAARTLVHISELKGGRDRL